MDQRLFNAVLCHLWSSHEIWIGEMSALDLILMVLRVSFWLYLHVNWTLFGLSRQKGDQKIYSFIVVAFCMCQNSSRMGKQKLRRLSLKLSFHLRCTRFLHNFVDGFFFSLSLTKIDIFCYCIENGVKTNLKYYKIEEHRNITKITGNIVYNSAKIQFNIRVSLKVLRTIHKIFDW